MRVFDDNNERERAEESLRYFYEEFSAGIKKQLLSKNLIAPQNVYDVLYPRTREALLIKNTPKVTDLDENSKAIRDALVAKIIESNIDLEQVSESVRKSLIAKNKIIQESNDLLNSSYNIRKNLLSKNTSSDSDLLKDSEIYKRNNLSNNNENISLQKNLDAINDSFRENNLSKNTDKGGDLLEDSNQFRDNNLNKNVDSNFDLEKNSSQFRDNNLNKNVDKKNTDLEEIANVERAKAQAKNNTSDSTEEKTLEDSQKIREKLLSKNNTESTNIDTNSKDFRDNNLNKNTSKEIDLEKDSKNYLKNNVSANKPDTGDLLSDSETYLKNNTSANKPDVGDLLIDSETYLKNNISANKSESINLEDLEAQFRKKNLSQNENSSKDLTQDSDTFRKNNLSNNKPNNSDLLSDSETYLKNNTSANKPDGGDLLSDSETFLKNNTSTNKPDTGDLEKDSSQFRDNNTSPNKPDTGDLLTDSETYLKNNTSPNKPDTGDLLTDSETYLKNNTSPNKPDTGDLLTDSETFLHNNTAVNVPAGGDLLTDSTTFLHNNTAANVPAGGDLLTDSTTFLHNNTAANVPGGGDLLTDSGDYYKNNLSANVSKNEDLEAFSKPFRDNNLSANPPVDPLGVNIEGIGTSTFLGVSRVLTQGIVLKQILMTKNKPSKYNIDTFVSSMTLDKSSADDTKNSLISKNLYQIQNSEYNPGTAVGLTSANIVGYFGKSVSDEVNNMFEKHKIFNRTVSVDLQTKYGSNDSSLEQRTSPIQAKIGGGFFSVNTVSPKGGDMLAFGNAKGVEYANNIFAGSITDAIRNYNLSRNLYNLYKLTPGDLESMTTLKNNNDEGFQDLISKTIGYLRGNDAIGSQLQSNLIPRGMLVANEGAYIKGGGIELLLRPQQGGGLEVGTAASMMAQTIAGNPLMDIEFQAGTKGVSHIINTIKNSDAAKFTINYDVQNAKKFVIGTTVDGAPKFARQRFTLANPYKPGNAKSLLFSLKNYSTGESFYFPPYIQNYSDSYGANWNSVNFLGRPEAVYTYNNSTREGSISFIVLTDYTQNLIIGRNFNSDSVSDVTINPRQHFTSKDSAQNKSRALSNQEAEAKQREINNTKKEYKQYNNIVSGGTPESNVLQQDIESLQKQSNSIQQKQENLLVEANHGTVYSETNSTVGNINDFMTSVPSRERGALDYKAEDSKKRIDEMIKSLAFQPAFFSGDKVDFLTKMEFLAKMTRPAEADEGSGFSFTRPPICHIHLGDWWNNDIVVDSVSNNYDDVPWTLDEGRVQPMWSVVTINFKFIGPYRGQKGGPVLSSDSGGFYQDRK